MSSTKVVLGIIAGASLGAIAGILFAPDKGSATRKKIIDQTNDLRSTLNDWATDFIHTIKGGDRATQNGNENETANEYSTGMNTNTMG